MELKPHGTYARYRKGCRCEKCTKAAYNRMRDYYDRLAICLKENPNDKRHGVTGYIAGCRCEKCVREHRWYANKRSKMLKERKANE